MLGRICKFSDFSIFQSSNCRDALDFKAQLFLVSAGFDAYELDPITQMSLRMNDFRTLANRPAGLGVPTAAVAAVDSSSDLRELMDEYFVGWSE